MTGLFVGMRGAVGRVLPFQLAFVPGTLDWLARCSVPLTLLSTGLWMQGRKHVMAELPTVRALRRGGLGGWQALPSSPQRPCWLQAFTVWRSGVVLIGVIHELHVRV